MIHGIIFDLDGTLIDSYKANVYRYNAMAKEFHFPLARTKKQKDYINAATTTQVFHRYAPQLHLADKALKKWEGKLYNFIHEVKLKPHVHTVLSTLAKTYSLALVTNRGSSTPSILRHFKLKKYFPVVITAADITHPKPDPEPILLALRRMKILPSEAIYVGDFHSDHKAAHSAHVLAVILNKSCRSFSQIEDLNQIFEVVNNANQRGKRTR